MDDINTVYALLVLIMFFVLLSRLDNRFGKIERELNEIKKRMDDYLKVQQRGVTEKVKPEGEALKKENEDISASPQIIEKTSTLETKQQKETVPEKQKPVVETVIRETLEETPEKTVETELEDVCVEAVPRQKKQVNYEKFIGENLFGKIGILIFVIGVGFFVKYAIDKNWINETFRTVLGFLRELYCWPLPNGCKRNIVHLARYLRVALLLYSILRLPLHSIIIISSRRLWRLSF